MREREEVTSVTLLADELIAFADSNPNAHHAEEYGVITMATCREVAALRDRLYTAERERDEARRERDVYASACTELELKERELERENTELCHRAERAERVVEAVRDYFNGEPTDDPLYAAWCAYSRDSSSVRALDAAEASDATP